MGLEEAVYMQMPTFRRGVNTDTARTNGLPIMISRWFIFEFALLCLVFLLVSLVLGRVQLTFVSIFETLCLVLGVWYLLLGVVQPSAMSCLVHVGPE